jgi:hypothetical protein
MIRRALLTLLIATAFGPGLTSSAKADIISTVGEFNGTPDFDFNAADYPLPSVLIGDFSFIIPAGYSVVGGTISGTFGNNDVEAATAPSDYFIGNGIVAVAECDDSLSYTFACDTASTPTSWSYTLTPGDLTNLSTEISAGSVDFTVLQNFAVSVQTGTTTLDLMLSPEPATVFIFSGGLAGIVLLRRFRKA